MSQGELLTVSEAARFFGRSAAWIRWREIGGDFRYEDGTLITAARHEGDRDDRAYKGRGHRRYSLRDIENMADSLLKRKRINEIRHVKIMNAVHAFRELIIK